MTLDSTLRALDPAREIPDDLCELPRARSTLALIMATGPATVEGRRSRRCKHPVRYVAVAATVALGVGVGQELLAGTTAYASWTATPRIANPTEEARWASDCRTRYSGHPYAVRLVELRGDYAYTVLGAPGGYEATCLMRDNGPDQEVTGAGYEGVLTQEPAGGSIVTHGLVASSDGNGHADFEVTGKAGVEVISIAFAADGTEVHAAIRDGFFSAWWPGRESTISQKGVPNPVVTIALRNGTTRVGPLEDYDVSPS
jgi:hypothetical protein